VPHTSGEARTKSEIEYSDLPMIDRGDLPNIHRGARDPLPLIDSSEQRRTLLPDINYRGHRRRDWKRRRHIEE